MSVAEYYANKKQKGMEDFMGFMKTGVKAGVSVARAAAGDWVGAVGMWVPDIAKSLGDAKGMFDKWQAGRGQIQPFVSSSDRGF